MTVLAEQTVLWLALGLAGLAISIPVIAVLAIFALQVADFDGDAGAVADVQRFIERTQDARASMPPGLPLFDREEGATMAEAIVRFQAEKERARQALWASSERRAFAHSSARTVGLR